VETLDAEQINHLKDHGTLPERSYDQNGNDPQKKANEADANSEEDSVHSDSTGAPADPSIGDLPKENGADQSLPPIDEHRRD
jgi:cell division protease FtsH